jgi:hypothetical protein
VTGIVIEGAGILPIATRQVRPLKEVTGEAERQEVSRALFPSDVEWRRQYPRVDASGKPLYPDGPGRSIGRSTG